MNQHDKFSHRFSLVKGRDAPLKWQAGGLTIFTGLLVLILMTMMLMYAARVGVLEQRVSSNELRQKIAFHAAESVADQGAEYMLANMSRIFSANPEAVQFGDTSFRAGWFANDGTTPGWNQCTADMIAKPNHPCGGDIPATVLWFFYDDPTTTMGDVTGADSMPIDLTGLPANSTARLTTLLCIIDFGSPAGGCIGAPADETAEQETVAVMQLMGYGYSDCTDTTDITTCTGEARVAWPLSNYKNLSGPPGVPLTAKGTFPPTGTAEIVANPNGGGLGVSLTTWLNENPACSSGIQVTSSGSWQTCEMHECYQQDSRPDGVTCTAKPCRCGPGGNDPRYFLSWKKSQTSHFGIDIIVDDEFPCDLFEFYFDVPRNMYTIVKSAALVMSDCNSLGPYHSGLIWISGPICKIKQVIGSPENPVMLVTAATETHLNSGAEIYGVFYAFDGEDINASVVSNGHATVYGAAVIDATLEKYQGTFQVVYADGVLANAHGLNGVGSVSGGWRDFGLPAWE